jgi:Flp pilus assembly protein TadD
MGQTELALTEAKDLVRRAADDPAIVSLAGEAYLASGDVAGAAREYERAKSLAPESAAVRTRLALVRLAEGDADRGLKELESTSARHPDDYQADLAQVATYLRQRQADKALEAVKVLEKKQPANPVTYNLRGLAPGEEKEFEITYPEDYGQPRLAGKTVRFRARVKGLQRKELPEVNDEFAQDLGDYRDLAELKDAIRKSILAAGPTRPSSRPRRNWSISW